MQRRAGYARRVNKAPLRLGAGAGYAGDRIPPAAELAEHGQLDWLVFECLAERTIALAQLARAHDPSLGYDPLLLARLRAVLPACLRQGTRVLSNMGAANPLGGARAVLREAKTRGWTGLRVAVVTGDDVLDTLRQRGLQLPLIDSAQPLASLQDRLVSANAYLGADALLPALATEAPLVLCGRVADPALFLAPLMHHFGWAADDWTRLGRGVLVGHLLECAGQITGGYFADPGFKDVPNLARLGFPLAEVDAEGQALITKLPQSGGCVTARTCTEQLLYEIENPARYLQPDVVADFSQVALQQDGPDRVRATGASGQPRPDTLKVTVGYRDGFIGEGQMSYAGPGCVARGQLALEVVRERLREAGLGGLETRCELIGINSVVPTIAPPAQAPAEVRLRVAVRAPSREQAEAVAGEVEALYTNGPAAGGGASKSVREVIAAASVLVPRDWVRTQLTLLTSEDA